MNRKLRKVLIVVLALIFLGSLVMVLNLGKEYSEGQDLYEQAEQIAGTPSAEAEQPDSSEPEPAPAEDKLADISLSALQEASRDAIGWIRIPDTALSYPIVQGEDNDYYLNHAWNGAVTSVGSVFMDYRCASDFSDFNAILYGHRMKDGSMFAALKYYSKADFWESHPTVYIKDENGTRAYAVFAAYEAPVKACTYDVAPERDELRQEFIDYALNQSVIQTGVVPAVTDSILTLSTCTGDGYDTRWVVQAVEVLTEDGSSSPALSTSES